MQNDMPGIVKPDLLRNVVSLSRKEVLSRVDCMQASSLSEPLILVDEMDQPRGSASKLDCHDWANIQSGGFLHRAFSLFVFNGNNELLLQKRAQSKVTFPGVWSNTCCSHPLNNDLEKETFDCIGVRRACIRRTEFEMGLKLDVSCIHYVTRVLYKAASCTNWGEHELDYVLIARSDDVAHPNHDEVSHIIYVDQHNLTKMMDNPANTFSPWFRLISKSLLPSIWGMGTNLPEIPKPDSKIHRFL